jgi:enediyne biosynthesis protein E4
MNRKITLLIALLGASIALTTRAQTFTRVADASNPITTDEAEHGGGSWVDINNDGLLDLFVSNGNLTSQNNALYLNLGGGKFKKITTGAIVTDGGSSIGSTWADYDNDGNLDCFVTNRNNFGNFLYHGNGDTTFTKITTGSIVTDISNSNTSSWIDLNNDGLLDLYTVNFMDNDFMYINNGSPDFTFTSQTANPMVSGAEQSIIGAWADYNNDMRPDLFIGNAGTQNDYLFTNTGNLSFTKTTLPDHVSDIGASWGDYNNDGNLDLFVANYLGDACILYKNSGSPSYSLTPVTGSAVAVMGNSVGSAWADVDNDGDLDLFVCDDGGNNHLFLNSGYPNYTFTPVTTGAIVTDGGNSFGCAFGDYDNDGQLDLYVANRLNEESFLYHNDGNSNHWITIKCTGNISNRSGIGAKVYVKAIINGNPIWQMREVDSQSGYNGENLWQHFGLGDATVIDTLIIKWPSGTNDSCYDVTPDRFYTATEGGCLSTAIKTPEINPVLATHFMNYPNPFHDNTTISYELTKEQNVTLQIYDVTGHLVKTLANDIENEGIHKVIFNGSELTIGCYFCKLTTSQTSLTKEMIVQ